MNTATPLQAPTPPLDLITTATALPARICRPNLRAEALASGELSRMLATDPTAALSSVVEIARGLCRAGTAGLSLLRSDRADGTTIRWEVVRGALASRQGIDTPRDHSPCGLCLDAGSTILVSRPTRAFAWLEDIRPAIVDGLIVPLRGSDGDALGTLWVAHHDSSSRFSSDDVRIAEQLAQQLVLALQLQDHARDRERALGLWQPLQEAQRTLLFHELEHERSRRLKAEAAEGEAQRALQFKDAMADEVNHRAKNTLQTASALLSLQARATSSEEVRRALLDGHERLQLLAEVHALLCKSADNTQAVSMPELLQTLCAALRQSFGRTRPGVTLQLAASPISLSADCAIVIALLTNEAVTNSYKHAFSNDAAGEITVDLRHTTEQATVLRIADTGGGADFARAGGGIGLKLMRMLAEQVHGVLDLGTRTGHEGTQITLTIPRGAGCDASPAGSP